MHDLTTLLHLKRQIVGIRRFKKSESAFYEALEFKQVRHQAYYCWLVKKATEGLCFKGDFSHFACDTAGWILGLAPKDYFGTSEEAIEGWLACGTYANEKVAQLIYEGIEPLDSVEYIAIGPLEAFPENIQPEVVILIGQPYSIMRAVQGYSAHYGFATELKMSGMCGICHESTALPLYTGKLSVSMLCSGTRHYAKWAADEMALSFPYKLLTDFYNGVVKTMNPCETDANKQIIEKQLKKPLHIEYKHNYYMKHQKEVSETLSLKPAND